MAELIWSEPALADLDAIADYIALEDPNAAKQWVARVFKRVEQLIEHPESGSLPPELRPDKTYRQIVEAPGRVFYRIRGKRIYILHAVRGEMLLRARKLRRKDR